MKSLDPLLESSSQPTLQNVLSPIDWAEKIALPRLREQFKINLKLGVFITIIDDDGFIIEIEVDMGTICATYDRFKTLGEARAAMKSIRETLEKENIRVFVSREDWERALGLIEEYGELEAAAFVLIRYERQHAHPFDGIESVHDTEQAAWDRKTELEIEEKKSGLPSQFTWRIVPSVHVKAEL